MRLTVNGEVKEIEAKDLSGLIGALKLNPERVTVELNGSVVPRRENRGLKDGDKIEIVSFVGGG